jgi:hypothetical protein
MEEIRAMSFRNIADMRCPQVAIAFLAVLGFALLGIQITALSAPTVKCDHMCGDTVQTITEECTPLAGGGSYEIVADKGFYTCEEEDNAVCQEWVVEVSTKKTYINPLCPEEEEPETSAVTATVCALEP